MYVYKIGSFVYITYVDISNQMTEVKLTMDVGFVNCTRHMHQSSANFNNIVKCVREMLFLVLTTKKCKAKEKAV